MAVYPPAVPSGGSPSPVLPRLSDRERVAVYPPAVPSGGSPSPVLPRLSDREREEAFARANAARLKANPSHPSMSAPVISVDTVTPGAHYGPDGEEVTAPLTPQQRFPGLQGEMPAKFTPEQTVQTLASLKANQPKYLFDPGEARDARNARTRAVAESFGFPEQLIPVELPTRADSAWERASMERQVQAARNEEARRAASVDAGRTGLLKDIQLSDAQRFEAFKRAVEEETGQPYSAEFAKKRYEESVKSQRERDMMEDFMAAHQMALTAIAELDKKYPLANVAIDPASPDYAEVKRQTQMRDLEEMKIRTDAYNKQQAALKARTEDAANFAEPASVAKGFADLQRGRAGGQSGGLVFGDGGGI